eukprot:1644777-Rhodomonas_salina.1
MEQGTSPRDLLRRSVRVSEFYLVPYGSGSGLGVDGDGSAQQSLSGLARGNVGAVSDSNNL